MPNAQYNSTDHAAQQIPEPYPYTLEIENTSGVDSYTFRLYSGTHRIGRKTITLAPAEKIRVPHPLPPETLELIDETVDLTLTPIP